MHFGDVTLHTERLVLRALGPNDTDDLFAIHADPETMRYWNEVPWTRREQAAESIARSLAARANGDSVRLGLEERAHARVIGTCALFSFHEESRRAEIGYALRRVSWGQGFMHEALAALVTYAFHTLDLHRLEADIDPRNAASARSLERLGFTCEGRLRERWIVAGEVSDTAFYGLLRHEWRTPSR